MDLRNTQHLRPDTTHYLGEYLKMEFDLNSLSLVTWSLDEAQGTFTAVESDVFLMLWQWADKSDSHYSGPPKELNRPVGKLTTFITNSIGAKGHARLVNRHFKKHQSDRF